MYRKAKDALKIAEERKAKEKAKLEAKWAIYSSLSVLFRIYSVFILG